MDLKVDTNEWQNGIIKSRCAKGHIVTEDDKLVGYQKRNVIQVN